MLHRTAGQFSSSWYNSCLRHLKTSTPLMHCKSSSPVRPNIASKHLDAIATSFLRHLIWVFLSQCTVLRCLMSRPAGMCITQNSQKGSGSTPSWTTVTLDRNWRYMKCSRRLPVLCATTGHPGTRHFNSCNNLGKDNTYVVNPYPTLSTPLVWGMNMPWVCAMCVLR